MAGATIVERFNIGRDIGRTRLNNNDMAIQTRFALAEHNDSMYVLIDETVFVFDKNTFDKTGEIRVNFPGSDFEREVFRFVVTNDGHAFIESRYTPSRAELWRLCLTTGDVVLLDGGSFPGFDTERWPWLVAHNRADDTIWFFRSTSGLPLYIHTFQYDADANVFMYRGSTHSEGGWPLFDGTSVFADTVWTCFFFRMHRNVWNVELHKFQVGNRIPRHVINVAYLNTLTIPQSPLYVPPYVWLMVERNRRIEMLKLRPHVY